MYDKGYTYERDEWCVKLRLNAYNKDGVPVIWLKVKRITLQEILDFRRGNERPMVKSVPSKVISKFKLISYIHVVLMKFLQWFFLWLKIILSFFNINMCIIYS